MRPIQNINGDFDDDSLDNSDFNDWEEGDYPFDEDDEPDCFFCNASGEGYTPDTKCAYCNGRGTVKRKY